MRAEVEQRLDAASRGHDALVAAVHAGNESFVVGSAGEDALFEIGSITKAFTGILLAQMCLAGEVALSDPLSDYLPDERTPTWRGREPTLEELATHRAGLPNAPKPLMRGELALTLGLRRSDPWAGVDETAYHRLVTRTRARPGGRVRYSSMGFGLLGDALAARAGVAWEELVRERVLAPLGMENTGVTVPDDARSRLLEGRSRRGRPRPPLVDQMPAAGSLRSSGADMLRFVRTCASPPRDRLGAAIEMAREPRHKAAGALSIGLGWLVQRRDDRPDVVWHNGGTWGFRSWAGVMPKRGAGVAVLTNTTRYVDGLGGDLLDFVETEA